MAAELRVGNVGSLIRLTIVDQDGAPVDVSSATLVLYLRSPKARLLTKTPSLTSGGTDGRIQYATLAGDLDVPGNWQAQAKVTISGSTWFSTLTSLPVSANLAP